MTESIKVNVNEKTVDLFELHQFTEEHFDSVLLNDRQALLKLKNKMVEEYASDVNANKLDDVFKSFVENNRCGETYYTTIKGLEKLSDFREAYSYVVNNVNNLNSRAFHHDFINVKMSFDNQEIVIYDEINYYGVYTDKERDHLRQVNFYIAKELLYHINRATGLNLNLKLHLVGEYVASHYYLIGHNDSIGCKDFQIRPFLKSLEDRLYSDKTQK